MDKPKVPALRTIPLKARPLTAHALSWSSDAELAIATDTSIHILIPEFIAPPSVATHPDSSPSAPPQKPQDDISAASGAALQQDLPPQFTIAHRVAGVYRPDPAMNARLCGSHGVKIPPSKQVEEFVFQGVGRGPLTGSGGGINQVVRVEWSPSGLGNNLRPVLAALFTHGHVMVLGEHFDVNAVLMIGKKKRNLSHWKILWGIGGRLPIPDHNVEGGGLRIMDEKLTSFSWAKPIGVGKALLAYLNDEMEITIMGVQHYTPDGAEQPIWKVEELARFDGSGPHEVDDAIDEDYVPTGTAFALKWSPWVIVEDSQTATLAYISKNHVGFRRISLHGEWELSKQPSMAVEPHNTISVCTFLSSDATVEWEDYVWEEAGLHVARGIITTPFVLKPFEIPLTGPIHGSSSKHLITECSTAYPDADESSTNPITGLVIHAPDSSQKSPNLQYTLSRLSATSTNQNWYESNTTSATARWAHLLSRSISYVTTRAAALTGADEGSDSSDEDVQADNIDPELKDLDDTPSLQLHPHRYRIWGIASSPRGGSSAALVTKHNNIHPSRPGRCELMFGWYQKTEGSVRQPASKVSAEGEVWEWMYGSKSDAYLFEFKASNPAISESMKDEWKIASERQKCLFCETSLQIRGQKAECKNGHTFASCSATGLTILKPGISRGCGICGGQTLKVAEAVKIIQELGVQGNLTDIIANTCGFCGGKFVV